MWCLRHKNKEKKLWLFAILFLSYRQLPFFRFDLQKLKCCTFRCLHIVTIGLDAEHFTITQSADNVIVFQLCIQRGRDCISARYTLLLSRPCFHGGVKSDSRLERCTVNPNSREKTALAVRLTLLFHQNDIFHCLRQ